MSLSAIDRPSSVALKMASVATRGSMIFVHREEGRMVLAASKLTAISLKWASLNKGNFMGVYGWKLVPVDVSDTLALFLPLPLPWHFQLFSTAS